MKMLSLLFFLAGGALADSPEKSLAFVTVEPGEFVMGSPREEKGRFDDETSHRVTISRPFQIAKTEVTQGLWKKVMGNLPKFVLKEDDSLPVNYVSYDDAQEFVRRFNKIQRGDGYFYRLPTEAEWEYAARGAQSASAEEKLQPYGIAGKEIDEYAWHWANTKIGIQPVATKKPNLLGVYDMAGNVWEWTIDKYEADASRIKIHPAFGHPVNLNRGNQYVVRGGCSNRNWRDLRSAARGRLPSDADYGNLGFRLVRVTHKK